MSSIKPIFLIEYVSIHADFIPESAADVPPGICSQMTPTPQASEEAVPLKTWIAVIGATLGAFLAVLNIQITNASLPYIEGGIGSCGLIQVKLALWSRALACATRADAARGSATTSPLVNCRSAARARPRRERTVPSRNPSMVAVWA